MSDHRDDTEEERGAIEVVLPGSILKQAAELRRDLEAAFERADSPQTAAFVQLVWLLRFAEHGVGVPPEELEPAYKLVYALEDLHRGVPLDKIDMLRPAGRAGRPVPGRVARLRGIVAAVHDYLRDTGVPQPAQRVAELLEDSGLKVRYRYERRAPRPGDIRRWARQCRRPPASGEDDEPHRSYRMMTGVIARQERRRRDAGAPVEPLGIARWALKNAPDIVM